MQVLYSPASLAKPVTARAPTPVNLAGLSAKQLAGLLIAPPQLLVDCGWLLNLHPLGVCRFVAQLLQLRQRRTCIGLCNVHPVLHRCLRQLELGPLFHLNG